MKTTFLAVMSIGMLIAFSATAATTVWFPFAKVAYSDQYTAHSGPLGGYGTSLYDQIDSSTANVVWNENSAFYWNSNLGHWESWWDVGPRNRCYLVCIMNTSDTDFSGSNRLKLELFNSDGSIVDEYKLWTNYDGSTGGYMINKSSAPLEWSDNDNCFYITLASGASISIGPWDCTYYFFNKPCSNPGASFGPTLKITQPNGLDFKAFLRGQIIYTYRIAAGDVQSSFSSFSLYQPAGYNGLDPLATDGGQDAVCLVLPWFKERSSQLDTVAEWVNEISVTNASASNDQLLIEVRNLDGSSVKSYRTGTLVPKATFSFIPSQFYTSADSGGVAGQVLIWGRNPVAVVKTERFPKTDKVVYSYKTRTADAVFLPLQRVE